MNFRSTVRSRVRNGGSSGLQAAESDDLLEWAFRVGYLERTLRGDCHFSWVRSHSMPERGCLLVVHCSPFFRTLFDRCYTWEHFGMCVIPQFLVASVVALALFSGAALPAQQTI